MNFRKLALATAAMTLVVAPISAQAASPQRASAPAPKPTKLLGNNSMMLVFLTIAVTAGAIVLATSNNLDPASP
ncbi:hypothetical protein [Tsuneonella mangrovi]|uniref:hypothetical protein n=1 Tax=Tsuneonella mangrovi TaxID=1982042 RepID=UPI000BA2083F|nr:hypothetical protein [Tsuneonella mangrovi]